MLKLSEGKIYILKNLIIIITKKKISIVQSAMKIITYISFNVYTYSVKNA